MNIYFWIGLGCIITFSLIAALAMINEIFTVRRARARAKPQMAHSTSVAIIIYVTSYETTRVSVESALALTEPRLRILVVDGNAKPAACRALRTAIRNYHDGRLTVYAKRKPLSRFDTIASALKHIPQSTHILVINSGDIIDEHALRQLTRSTPPHHRTPSIEHSTSVSLLAVIHLARRAALLFPGYRRRFSSGTALFAPHPESLRQKLYATVTTSVPEHNPFSRYRTRSLLLLTITGFASLSLCFSVLYTSATLHTIQPLLLLSLVTGYIFIVSVLEAPFLQARDRLQLMTLVPMCGIVLPIGLLIAAAYELARRAIASLRVTATAAVDSDSSTIRAPSHLSPQESPTVDTSL